MYSVTLRHVHATIVTVEKQWVLHILRVCYSLRYPACNACAPYCYVARLAVQYFLHFLIMSTIFQKKLLDMSCVFWFSLQLWNISHSKKNWARYNNKCTLVFVPSTHYSCYSLIKVEFSQQSFDNYTKIKFDENPSSGSRVVPCGQMDGQSDRQTWWSS